MGRYSVSTTHIVESIERLKKVVINIASSCEEDNTEEDFTDCSSTRAATRAIICLLSRTASIWSRSSRTRGSLRHRDADEEHIRRYGRRRHEQGRVFSRTGLPNPDPM